jgi:general secretion pathway protein G
MNKFMKKRKMRGFTLVELLIVIIIIGILAGALLLVAGAGTDKANATKIVSDGRSVKSAALMYYADNNAWPSALTDIDGYIDRDINSGLVTFGIESTDTGATYNVNITGLDTLDAGIVDKLAAIAAEGGLYDNATATDDTVWSADADAFLRIKATQ